MFLNKDDHYHFIYVFFTFHEIVTALGQELDFPSLELPLGCFIVFIQGCMSPEWVVCVPESSDASAQVTMGDGM